MDNSDYYQINGWMINELGLSGNDLIIYAIIYGFSMDKKTEFFGSLSYLQKTSKASKPTVLKSIKFLIKKSLIFKRIEVKNGVTFNYYRPNLDFKKEKMETQKKDFKTYVMYDKHTSYYKIGKALNPKFREETLQALQPMVELILINNSDIEKELHFEFSEKRIRGEWFSLSNEDILYLIKNKGFIEIPMSDICN